MQSAPGCSLPVFLRNSSRGRALANRAALQQLPTRKLGMRKLSSVSLRSLDWSRKMHHGQRKAHPVVAGLKSNVDHQFRRARRYGLRSPRRKREDRLIFEDARGEVEVGVELGLRGRLANSACGGEGLARRQADVSGKRPSRLLVERVEMPPRL